MPAETPATGARSAGTRASGASSAETRASGARSAETPATVVIADIDSWDSFVRFGAILRRRRVAVARFTAEPRTRAARVRARLQGFLFPHTRYGPGWSGADEDVDVSPFRGLLGARVLAVEAVDRLAAAMVAAGIVLDGVRRTAGAVEEAWLYDKLAMTRHVASSGLPVPVTWADRAAVDRAAVDRAAVDRAGASRASDGGIPPGRPAVVVKHRVGSGGQAVRVVDADPVAIAAAWCELSADPTRVFAQEFVPGETVHVGGVARAGRMLVSGAYRSNPATAVDADRGPARSVEIIDDPPLVAAAQTIVASLGYTGALSIDFVRDAASRPLFVDFNSRVFGSWLALERAGMDFIGAYLYAYGLATTFRVGAPSPGAVVSALPTTAVNHTAERLAPVLARSVAQTVADSRILGARWAVVALAEIACATGLRVARVAVRRRPR